MRMFAEDDKGVIFYETVITLKWQKHTCIECVPLPWEQYELIPGYFKVQRLPFASTHKHGIYIEYAGINLSIRGRVVSAQKADRLFYTTWWFQASDGAQPAIFYGSI